MNQRGFSLIEILIVAAILVTLAVAVFGFGVSLFRQNDEWQTVLRDSEEARSALQKMIPELRAAGRSDAGAYPLQVASSTELVFWSDPDKDGSTDEVRYFTDGSRLRRSVDGQTKTLVNQLLPGDIFTYYEGGDASTAPPLPAPVAIASVRLIKVTLAVPAGTYASQTAIRSLKDNL